MKIVLKNEDYITINKNTLDRIIDSTSEFYKINVEREVIDKKGNKEIITTTKLPYFVNILKKLTSADAIEEYMQGIMLRRYEEMMENHKSNFFFSFTREHKEIWRKIYKEVTFDTAIKSLYDELLSYKDSPELMTISERRKKGIGSLEELEKEERLNPEYDYEYLIRLYNLSLEQISYVKNDTKVKTKKQV